jgi:2-polyprenyl-3-methyl-5-hydroxy-6-metoxy-1,4-benzoquinol methylase
MDLIDYRQIADKYTFQEHAERADRYFAAIGLNSHPARKPFASPEEAIEIASGLSAILSGLKPFNGAKVLDFGAGSCWLSRALALMGCEVTATDVSAHALKLGEQLISGDPLAQHMRVSFAVTSEQRLSFPDRSFDRIVVFDAFHHCKDQLAMIGEFHRVLMEDGIVAFHEPGPHHSRHPQSQYEMRTFDVIEGDIKAEELIAEAHRVGFNRAELALFLAHPVMASLSGFNSFMAGGTEGITDAVRRESENRRVFFLYKGDPFRFDSRSPTGLRTHIALTGKKTEAGIAVRGTVTNTGPTTWLPSSGGMGSVNIGVHLHDSDGALLDLDYARLPLSPEPIREGQSVTVEGLIPAPSSPHFSLTIDLVAEGVSWFEMRGSEPCFLHF